ncbi:hypothetical protein QQ73_21570, partial [Candidatus Endoriftia persephone str. Guaymas]|nr:hypothetical protein [Candidatus Endoriftia persephone str. Guaymas]
HPISKCEASRPMGDDYDCSHVHLITTLINQPPLSLRIEHGCCFVQEENRWIDEKHARQRNSLSLTTG